MATFSDEQFQQMLAALKPQADQSNNDETTAEASQPKNDPAALGTIRTCDLGTNKMLKLTRFEGGLVR